MKHIIIILLAAIATLTTSAQEVKRQIKTEFDDELYSPSLKMTTPMTTSPTLSEFGVSLDSLHLPELDDRGRVMIYNYYPYYFGGTWSNWRLHEGLNLSLGTPMVVSVLRKTSRCSMPLPSPLAFR